MIARKGALLLLAICLTAISSLSALAQGQTTGRIVGTVKDEGGAVIMGAEVTVAGKATGEERKVTTDDSGYYAVPLLSPGVYQVAVTANGFKKVIIDNVRVVITETSTVDAEMTVGALTED